jgi:hypothetical protein
MLKNQTPTTLSVYLLPLAQELIRDSRAGVDLLGSDYGDFAREEANSLAYAMAETALTRIRELEAS